MIRARVDTSRAFYLIGTGLFKKVVIANFLAGAIVDDVFGAPGQHSSLELLVAIYAYAVQIYADFSGYTDIAIGIALLLGFKFPQNFDSPYAAVSVQDFWRRWHMTLSRWLRDYVYIPLGGNRKGGRRTYVNLMLTMLIGGLWHGAGWTFVVWGGLHGLYLATGRLRRGPDEAAPRGFTLWRRRVITFHLVCLAWVFFRADSFGNAKDVLGGLFTRWGQPSPLVTFGVVVAIVAGIASQYIPPGWPRLLMDRFSRLPVVAQATVLGDRIDGDERDGPGGRGTLHLLPLLMAVDSQPTTTRPRRSRPRATDDGRRALTAGHALVIALLALVVGSLLNAPGMHKSAFNQPNGWKRDVALAITGPLASVSHALLLDRPRKLLQDALGRGDEDKIDTTISFTPPAVTTPRSHREARHDDVAPGGPSPHRRSRSEPRSAPSTSCASGSPATRS